MTIAPRVEPQEITWQLVEASTAVRSRSTCSVRTGVRDEPLSLPNHMGQPIFAAALQGNLSAITANIADANAATADGYTPLQLAVSAGQEQAAAVLLSHGVSVNAADNTGVTALMHAAMHGHSGIVDTLHAAHPNKAVDVAALPMVTSWKNCAAPVKRELRS